MKGNYDRGVFNSGFFMSAIIKANNPIASVKANNGGEFLFLIVINYTNN